MRPNESYTSHLSYPRTSVVNYLTNEVLLTL